MKSFDGDVLAKARRTIKNLEGKLELVKAAADLFNRVADQPKRRFQVAHSLNSLSCAERATCRVVGFERSTYFDNKHHVASNQVIRRLLLNEVIGEEHANSRDIYGRLRVTATLRIEHGLIAHQKLVARIMRDLDIHGLPKRSRVIRNLANVTTHNDMVNRNFWLIDPMHCG